MVVFGERCWFQRFDGFLVSLVIFAVVAEAFDRFVFLLLHAFTAFCTFEAPAVLTAQRGEELRVTERGTHVSAVLNHTYELVFGFYLRRRLWIL